MKKVLLINSNTTTRINEVSDGSYLRWKNTEIKKHMALTCAENSICLLQMPGQTHKLSTFY